MKYAGKTLTGSRISTVVIPRGDAEIVINAAAVLDYTEFEENHKSPVPPIITKPGGESYPDTLDADYIQAVNKWATLRTNWMILESLKATPELEWETVTADPETWGNYEDELKAAGFSPVEIFRITDLIIQANGLDQEKIDEATKRFLASQAEA